MDDADPGAEDEDSFGLTPLVVEYGPTSILIVLRAEGRFEHRLVRFEEAAQIKFDEEVNLSDDEVKAFGADYILPFLLPYVESGFARLCAEVGETPPEFPFTVKGRLYAIAPKGEVESRKSRHSK